jgi:putative heme-binding domain-containing protein
LTALLVPQTDRTLQAAAVTTIAHLHRADVPHLLLRGWKGYGPELRGQVLDSLFQRDDWVKEMLAALEKGQVLPFEVDAARRQRLSQHRRQDIRDRVNRLFAGSTNPDRQKVIDAYRGVLALKGDSGRGAQIFVKVCATCHQFRGVGHPVGPDLASLGDKSPESILIAVLDPNRAVEARYINYVAMTKNGLTFTGVLASETGNSITLLGQDGKQQVILRGDLEELASSNKSLMPEGLEKDLRPQDVADLIAHLRAGLPAPKRRIVEGNRPELIKPEADGSLRLLPSKCELFGSTVILEKQYGNLGYWSSEDDDVVWTILVTRPGTYAVWFDWACERGTANNQYILQAGLRRLTGRVPSTGSWDKYRQAQFGEIALEAGQQRIELRSAGKINGALIDLRGIHLIPVDKK